MAFLFVFIEGKQAPILGLHCHEMKIKMPTIQYRRTRIWEMKKDKYTKTLAKNQVCEIFQMRDIGKNGLPKFINLCMETPCWCPVQEHQYGRRIPTETSVFEFSY